MRVASYNLYLGVDLSLLFGVPAAEMDAAAATLLAQLEVTDFSRRARAIARLLLEADADLVGLQEVTTWTLGGEVVCDFLVELTTALGSSYSVHALNANFAGAGAGLTIQGSNVTLVRHGVSVQAEGTGDFDAGLVVPTPVGEVRIARSYGWVDAEVEGREVRFVNTHTEAYDEQVRNAQRDEVLAAIGDPGRPVVLVGDFNAEPAYVGMPEPWADAWLMAGGSEGYTCGQGPDLRNEVSTLTQRIDYVWVRDLEVSDCRLIGADPADRAHGLWPSDHAGVVADLQ